VIIAMRVSYVYVYNDTLHVRLTLASMQELPVTSSFFFTRHYPCMVPARTRCMRLTPLSRRRAQLHLLQTSTGYWNSVERNCARMRHLINRLRARDVAPKCRRSRRRSNTSFTLS